MQDDSSPIVGWGLAPADILHMIILCTTLPKAAHLAGRRGQAPTLQDSVATLNKFRKTTFDKSSKQKPANKGQRVLIEVAISQFNPS